MEEIDDRLSQIGGVVHAQECGNAVADLLVRRRCAKIDEKKAVS